MEGLQVFHNSLRFLEILSSFTFSSFSKIPTSTYSPYLPHTMKCQHILHCWSPRISSRPHRRPPRDWFRLCKHPNHPQHVCNAHRHRHGHFCCTRPRSWAMVAQPLEMQTKRREKREKLANVSPALFLRSEKTKCFISFVLFWSWNSPLLLLLLALDSMPFAAECWPAPLSEVFQKFCFNSSLCSRNRGANEWNSFCHLFATGVFFRLISFWGSVGGSVLRLTGWWLGNFGTAPRKTETN